MAFARLGGILLYHSKTRKVSSLPRGWRSTCSFFPQMNICASCGWSFARTTQQGFVLGPDDDGAPKVASWHSWVRIFSRAANDTSSLAITAYPLICHSRLCDLSRARSRHPGQTIVGPILKVKKRCFSTAWRYSRTVPTFGEESFVFFPRSTPVNTVDSSACPRRLLPKSYSKEQAQLARILFLNVVTGAAFIGS